MKKLLIFFAALACVANANLRVEADTFFGFSIDGSVPVDAGPLTVQANVGETLNISVYYVETGDDEFLLERGMVGFGFGAEFNTEFGNVATTVFPPPVGEIPNITPRVDNQFFGFNDSTRRLGDGAFYVRGRWQDNSGLELNRVDTPNGPLTQGLGRGERSYRVVDFEFDVTGAGVTNIDLFDPDVFSVRNPTVLDPTGGELDQIGFGIYDSEQVGVSIDEQIFGPVVPTPMPRLLRLTIDSATAVPEPSSVAALGLLFGGLVVRRRRR